MLPVSHQALKQGGMSVCVGVSVPFSLARTSRSLRLCGCLYAIMVGSGIAVLSQSETCRVLAILARAGW